MSKQHHMWGGRFAGGMDANFASFNATLPVDYRLFSADVQASAAYANALHHAGILDDRELEALRTALARLHERAIRAPAFITAAIDAGIEDIHCLVEGELFKDIGDTALKLNTGRSRNDQVVTDLRLYLREQTLVISAQITKVEGTLLQLAEADRTLIIPSYTHLQRAQPVLWAHHLLAYFEMFERDKDRLRDSLRRLNIMPLGAGAVAGSGFTIDRERLAEELGFAGITANSMDAVSDRDFVIEFNSALAILAMHLSRLAEDLICFSTAEFGFLELGDTVTTGSSLLPQKKNPDGLELIRGKAGRVFGNQLALLTMMKGLPLSYNKDMAEDKEAVFDSLDTMTAALTVMAATLATVTMNPARIHAALDGSEILATELADFLVRQGVPFRKAHSTVGAIVKQALASGRRLALMTVEELKAFAPEFNGAVAGAMTLAAAVAAKDVFGGTAPERVAAAIAAARQKILAS